jgi:hypothetical protein
MPWLLVITELISLDNCTRGGSFSGIHEEAIINKKNNSDEYFMNENLAGKVHHSRQLIKYADEIGS